MIRAIAYLADDGMTADGRRMVDERGADKTIQTSRGCLLFFLVLLEIERDERCFFFFSHSAGFDGVDLLGFVMAGSSSWNCGGMCVCIYRRGSERLGTRNT